MTAFHHLRVVAILFLHIAIIIVVYFCRSSAETTLSILDVGQGDALLLKTSSGHTVLIDTGPDRQVLSALDQLLPVSKRSLDLVFLTHPHADHIGGFLDVMRRYHVGGVVMTNVYYESTLYDQVISVLKQENIPVWEARADWDWQIDDHTTLDILYPFTSLSGYRSFKNVNNSSIVMMLKTSQSRCLLTGDMEEPLEQILLHYYGVRLRADCLKAAHHGSKTSSAPDFLSLVQPAEVFVSVGRNNLFHHPAETTLKNLESWAIIKRTDIDGTITKKLL